MFIFYNRKIILITVFVIQLKKSFYFIRSESKPHSQIKSLNYTAKITRL